MLLQPTRRRDNDNDEGGTGQGLEIIAAVHETFELVPEARVPAAVVAGQPSDASSRGKWHEKFGRHR